MAYQRCSRCKTAYPLKPNSTYFAGDLSLCLTCYSRVNGNEGLSVPELVRKASRSRTSKKLSRLKAGVGLEYHPGQPDYHALELPDPPQAEEATIRQAIKEHIKRKHSKEQIDACDHLNNDECPLNDF